MELKVNYLTQNDCYKAGGKLAPKGIMVHSTAAPGVMAEGWVQRWNKSGLQVCCHAFLDDKEVIQTLPWEMRAWHCGSGPKGSGNDTHLSFEICEPAGMKYNANGSALVGYNPAQFADYFAAIWKNAVELCAMLCKKYSLDPLQDGVLICHSEGCARGIASNHADVLHWWPKHSKSMEDFRQAVSEWMGGEGAQQELTAISGRAVATAEQMQAYLHGKNPNAPDYAALYLEEGEAEGIRGDIAFAQSCLETGNWKFGGDVKLEQNNFCGLGATGGGEPGNSFASPREGIRAQIQHLKAYANTQGLNQECVDPRFRWVQRGCAPYVEWLGQKENPQGKGWAAAKDYGTAILQVFYAICAQQTEEQGADALKAKARLEARVAQLEAALQKIAAIAQQEP